MRVTRLARLTLLGCTMAAVVLAGCSDRVVSPAYGRAYAELIPRARFELIERAGHYPEIEQPDAFVERIVAFLKE